MNDMIPLLLVEDEPELRDALGEYLEACGFLVQVASTAGEALLSTWGTPPQILLTDLSLPDLRGETFVPEFHRRHPECLLYVHSGDSEFVPNPTLVACGLTQDHVLSKPTDLGAMVARFRRDLKNDLR